MKPLTVTLYGGVFVAIVAVIAAGYKIPQSTTDVANVSATASEQSQSTSVNEVTATVIAANVAEATNLPVSAILSSRVITLEAEREIAATSSADSVSKQEIIQPTGDRRSLITHTVKSGETVSDLAKEYGVSEDTIKWANDLTSNKLSAGAKITIPPVDGVVHTVASGETAKSIAEKYKTSEARVVAFNDLELGGLKGGAKIVVPAGILPTTERPGYVAPVATTTTGYSFTSGNVGNRYAPGWCTWYAYERRPDIGSFWGDATNWAYAASNSGFTVVRGVPKAGAIFQYGSGSYGGYYGHAGIVESVDEAAGTMVITDMNGIAGFGQVGRDTVAINKNWNYIY